MEQRNSMAMTQEPIQWRYIPYKRPMYMGMHPQHMALYGQTYGTIPLGLGFMPAITGRTLFGLCSKSLRHCMILVFLSGFLYWIDIIPNILGMTIALNHQPTEVLNTAQFNVVNLSGKKRALVWWCMVWFCTGFTTLGLEPVAKRSGCSHHKSVHRSLTAATEVVSCGPLNNRLVRCMEVSQNQGTPKLSILKGFCPINTSRY